jgi:hypothetical protein
MRTAPFTALIASLCLPSLALAGAPAPAQCPMVLDFDFDAAGQAILAGQDVSNAYSAWGIDLIVWTAMSMNPSDLGLPIAFDSANPTGGDWDLGTPNQSYGGPGVGVGGATNTYPLGNLLISAENTTDANNDGYVDVPDDDAGGAWFEFFFDQPTCLFSMTVIDIDAGETPPDLVVYDAAGNQLEWIDYSTTGNNGVETRSFGICGADHIMVDVYSSGAIDNLVLCNGGTPEVCDGVDNDGDGDIDEGGSDAEAALADSTVYGGSSTHAMWLPGVGNFVFNPDGTFEEDLAAGTATLTGTLERIGSPDKRFAVNATFSGRTTVAGAGSPKQELLASAYAAAGGPVDPGTWYYYNDFSGTLTGQGTYAGASLSFAETGPNFQVGYGANGKNANYGGSGWFTVAVNSQPSGSSALNPNGNGDFNLDFTSTCFAADVCDGIDNDGDGQVDEDGAGADGADADLTVFTVPAGGGSLDRAFWLSGIGDFQFSPDGFFEENPAAGTATLTGTLQKQGTPCAQFEASLTLTGRTTAVGAGSPHLDLNPSAYVAGGGTVDPSTWYYYEDFVGTLTGQGCYAGAVVELTEYGANLQVGAGANGRNTGWGTSAWVNVSVTSQPTSGPALAANGNGDFNLDLGACFQAETCDGLDNNGDGQIDEGFDVDGDGVTSCGGDCDDADAGNFPGNSEVCDGDDENCDGLVDEGYDVDGDGYTVCGGDCDDSDAGVNPGATEVCNGDDEDCDGLVDEGFDADGDGYTVCGGDCDDSDAGVNPGATEVCDGDDEDCDGLVDEGFDADGDGYTVCDGDCDDGDASAYPGATELCDGVDNDCDGIVDVPDGDGDGYTVCDGDCDDADAAVNPGATEICNGIDDNCDGLLLDGEDDDDADGVTVCEGDCDDADPDTYPGASELCDGVDNDCDGVIPVDEYDWDGDGMSGCDGDCNDGDPTIYDGAPEFCDNIDTDCDGAADNGFDVDGDGIPDCVDSCPQIIDNDEDPWGDVLATGTDVTNSYQNWGVTIERFEDGALSVAVPAVTWDSGNPTGGLEDLGTPNVDFGGPGIGADGGLGDPGVNEFAQANVQKGVDGNTWWVVSFSSATCVHSIRFIDVDQNELPAQVILFDVNVQTINTITSSALGNNSVEELDLGGTCGVYVMMIDMYAEGAWDDLQVCVDPNGGPEVCGDLIDNDGDGLTDEDCAGNGPDVPVMDPNAGSDSVGDLAAPASTDGSGCSQGGAADPRLALVLLMGLAVGVRRRRLLA